MPPPFARPSAASPGLRTTLKRTSHPIMSLSGPTRASPDCRRSRIVMVLLRHQLLRHHLALLRLISATPWTQLLMGEVPSTSHVSRFPAPGCPRLPRLLLVSLKPIEAVEVSISTPVLLLPLLTTLAVASTRDSSVTMSVEQMACHFAIVSTTHFAHVRVIPLTTDLGIYFRHRSLPQPTRRLLRPERPIPYGDPFVSPMSSFDRALTLALETKTHVLISQKTTLRIPRLPGRYWSVSWRRPRRRMRKARSRVLEN